jgi:hypothetical protein
MHRADVENALSEWVVEITKYAALQNQASFQLLVTAHYLTRVGHIPEGEDEPPAGIEHWRVALELWFPAQGPPDNPHDVGLAIAAVLDAMSVGVKDDPTLGRRVIRARWRESSEPAELDTGPEGFPYRVEAYMTLQAAPGL